MSLVPKTWWQMPCPALSSRFLPLPPPFMLSLPFPSTSPPPMSIFQHFPPFKPIARQFSQCYLTLPSLWSPFLSRNPLFSVMCLPDLHGLWFPFLSAVSYFLLSTSSLTLLFVLPGDCCPLNSCGLASQKMSTSEPEAVSAVNRARSSLTSNLLFQASTSQVDVFLTCIWIWWGRCLPAKDIVIS